MPRYADKNDVDISQLFKWSKEVVITDGDRSVTLYVRLVGDAELARARAYAFRKSAEIRKKLKTEGTDERISFIAELEEVKNKNLMTQSVILLSMGEINMQALREVNLPEPKEPKSDASQEELENYQLAVDAFPGKYTELVNAKVLELRKAREDEIKKLTLKQIYELYESLVIERLCTEEMQLRYYDMCTYLGVYKDKNFKVRAFSSIDEFDNAHSSLKNRLKEEYQSIELGMDVLKKLPEATES